MKTKHVVFITSVFWVVCCSIIMNRLLITHRWVVSEKEQIEMERDTYKIQAEQMVECLIHNDINVCD